MSTALDLLVAFDFPPMGGGIARWMAEIALRYPPGGLIVSTGSVPGSEAWDAGSPNPVDRVAIPSRRLKNLQGLVPWSRRVSSLVTERDVGFVWCGNLRPGAYPAKWAHQRTGVPYGILVHGGDLLALQHNYRASRLKRSAARALLGTAHVLVANSRWTHDLAREVLEEVGLPGLTRRVRVVPLGTDPALFHPGLDPEAFRVRHGLPAGPWLVTVARLVAHKGIDTTVQALGRLTSRYPDLRYAIVGQGSEQGALSALARREGVADRVRFLTGIADEELPLAYALATIYVGVSRRTARDVEGFGIALLEAQGSGKPVVAGNSGGIPDAVRDGVTGVLVDPESPAAVAEAIAALLDDHAARTRMGRAGREAVVTHFNWPRVVRELREISGAARSDRR